MSTNNNPHKRDHFMSKRPAKGRLFLCANDVAFLFHVHIGGGIPPLTSQTQARSFAILLEQYLITGGPNGEGLQCTERGDAVIRGIVNLTAAEE